MDDIAKKLGIISELDPKEITWGESKQERIIERTSRSKSARHTCKGPKCDKAFDKL